METCNKKQNKKNYYPSGGKNVRTFETITYMGKFIFIIFFMLTS